MVALRTLTKDKPYDSLENVIWWIEYVMRHNGAPHLRFDGVDSAWYQQFDLDLVIFLAIMSFLALCVFLGIAGWGLTWLYKRYDRDNGCKHLEVFANGKMKAA